MKQTSEAIQENNYLKDTIKIMQEQIQSSEDTIQRLYREFDSNSDDPYKLEHLTGLYAKKAKDLAQNAESPYFARIDFQELGKNQKDEKLYIGKCSVMRDNSTMQVIDWRSPVASLYYDERNR